MGARELAVRAWGLVRARRPVLAFPAVALVAFGDIISQIENAILGFFESIWNGISSFFGTIFGAIAQTFATIFSAPGQAIQSSFASLNAWAAQYGPLAPVITILIVAAVIVIGTYLIWFIIKVSVSEGEQTGEEAEEGV